MLFRFLEFLTYNEPDNFDQASSGNFHFFLIESCYDIIVYIDRSRHEEKFLIIFFV